METVIARQGRVVDDRPETTCRICARRLRHWSQRSLSRQTPGAREHIETSDLVRIAYSEFEISARLWKPSNKTSENDRMQWVILFHDATDGFCFVGCWIGFHCNFSITLSWDDFRYSVICFYHSKRGRSLSGRIHLLITRPLLESGLRIFCLDLNQIILPLTGLCVVFFVFVQCRLGGFCVVPRPVFEEQ